jgi:hypothetical protein
MIRTLLAVTAVWMVGLGVAHANSCKFKADREGAADAAGVTKVVMRTGAGDLNVVGTPGAKQIVARGSACASSQELLDRLVVEVRRDGDVLYINAGPKGEMKGIWIGSAYAYMNVGIALPPDIPVDAQDSSGDVEMTNLASVNLRDSSGDIRIRDVGEVTVEDGSGDIDIGTVRGNVTIPLDGSGDIEIADVRGSVTIGADGSGDIRVRNVAGSVNVDADGSGSIHVSDVKGDFTVTADGSGGIDYRNVGGKVSVP